MRRFSFFLIFLLALPVSSCDPGIHYAPRDWTKVSERRWSGSAGEIDVETSDLGGLVGEKSLHPEISVHNRSQSPATLESAILKTAVGQYLADSPRSDWGKWEVAPGQTQRLEVRWTFVGDSPIYNILRDPVEMNLKFRVRDEMVEFTIPMVKFRK